MKLEDYKELVFTHTKQPKPENTTWAETSKLCMLFIEFRSMDILKYNLWNIANVYGGGDTSLVIVHSGENRDMIMQVTKDWKNVRYEQVFERNTDVNEYSRLLTSVSFWEKFKSHEHVLINQWDSYIFRRIPEHFFEYDYVGSPCGHYYVIFNNQLVNICHMTCECPRCLHGDHPFKENNFISHPDKIFMFNGGFSLRKVKTMFDFCNVKPWRGEPEDVYFCISTLSRPTRDEAREFGVQDFKYDGVPVGCHQIWLRQDDDYIYTSFLRHMSP
jgi:hypothetical protein